MNPVTEALKSGRQIEKILIQKGIQASKSGPLILYSRETGTPVQFVPVEKLNSITRKNHQGVVAFISGITYHKCEELVISAFESGRIPLFIMLDRITDVRNFGSIARSAECAAVDGIIVPAKGSALITADAVKTSSGALNYIPVARETSLPDTALYLKNSGIQLIAATEKGAQNHDIADYTIPTAIVLGSEEDGISPALLGHCDRQVKIPLTGRTQSLNVAVAAGIMIFEARRQRMQATI